MVNIAYIDRVSWICRTGKCRTEKWRTNCKGGNWRTGKWRDKTDEKERTDIDGSEFAGLENDGQVDHGL